MIKIMIMIMILIRVALVPLNDDTSEDEMPNGRCLLVLEYCIGTEDGRVKGMVVKAFSGRQQLLSAAM